jgi:hypothetical protein
MPIERGSQLARIHVHSTANFCDPNTLTCATPLTVEIRWARFDCAYSSNVDSGSVFDRRMMKKID